MRSEIKFVSPGFKVSFIIGLCATVIIVYLATVYRFEVGLILLSVAGSIGVIGIAYAGRYTLAMARSWQLARLDVEAKRQEVRLTTYQADKAALESSVLVVPKTHQVISFEDRRPRIIEGTSMAIPASSHPMLPAGIEQPITLDLLTVFTQLTQSYAIIGGAQTGKTYQARHIAAYWLRQGFKPLVIGPKWDAKHGEWAGCIRLGGKGDFDRVSKGITLIQHIAHNRHANEDKGHKEHKVLPVFFDDWTNIIKAVDNAKELIFEATTLYASVNIILYFIIHSDTANAWGTDRTGAALKNNFVKLFILPTYNEQGLVIHSQTRGAIRFPGETTDRPVKLFASRGPIYHTGHAKRNDFDLDRLNLEPAPDPTEARILDLYRQGESISAIATAVYGSKGGNQNEQVKTVLTRFNWGKV